MISISHAPNATVSQRALAASLLMPWHMPSWKNGEAIAALEASFANRHDAGEAVSFATGRQALYACLAAAGVGFGDEVIIQAYTCIVVPHAVVWAGAQPIYADIDDTLNLDPEKLEALITPKTKAVVVQHTFGVPADLTNIAALCAKRRLMLIEDCAHALGASVNGSLVGTFGDFAIFSLGRDKIISATAGGVAIAKAASSRHRLREIQRESPFPSHATIFQNLLHPILVQKILGHLQSKWGTMLMRFSQTLGLLNKVYTPAELSSELPATLTQRLPNAMAKLSLEQIHELPNFAAIRQNHVEAYRHWLARHKQIETQGQYPATQSANLRFTIFLKHPHHVVEQARRRGFILGDWYTHPIMPRPVDESALGYKNQSCPVAESAAERSLNLPTHPLLTAADRENLLRFLDTLL